MEKKEKMATRTHCDGCDRLMQEVVDAQPPLLVSTSAIRLNVLRLVKGVGMSQRLALHRGVDCIVNLDMCQSCLEKLVPLLPKIAQDAIHPPAKPSNYCGNPICCKERDHDEACSSSKRP